MGGSHRLTLQQIYPSMSVSCVCGKASITLTNPSPRKCVECCCCDCHLALVWCHEQGGPRPPSPPLALLYFDNDISAVRGEEHLIVVKLRKNGASERLVAACCYTTLAVSHWAYFGNRLMVLPGAQIHVLRRCVVQRCLQRLGAVTSLGCWAGDLMRSNLSTRSLH